MRLYRGIAVPMESVGTTIDSVRRHGLRVRDDGYRAGFQELKPYLIHIMSLPDITCKDVQLVPPEQTPHRVCACADKNSALYYACHHNRTKKNDASILIAFESDISDVIVDGRDFLYKLFQFGDPDRARPIAERLFGEAILRYLDRAWAIQSDDQSQRIFLCDLAIHDEQVIRRHAANKTVIGGSWVNFCTAFMARLPILNDRIVSVEQIDPGAVEYPDPEITLPMVLALWPNACA